MASGRLASVKVCEVCGEQFRPFPASVGRFCSFKCRRREVRQDPLPSSIERARWIPLGNNRFSLVDEADYDRVNAFVWSDDGRGGIRTFYEKIDGKRIARRVRLHHFITGAPSSVIIDHKDGDETNNRRDNLRPVNDVQSAQNRGKRVRRKGQAPKSRFKGVWEHTLRSGKVKYTAVITAQRNRTYLGIFDTEEEAAEAHDEAARRLHGEYACVNFPREGERGAVRAVPSSPTASS